jgi:hypothetical protein
MRIERVGRSEDICGSKAASQSRNTKWLRKQRRRPSCVAHTPRPIKELRAHSKAKTRVVKIAKLTKRSVGSLRQKALKLGIRLGSPALVEHHMTLFNKVFSTRTLLQIICILGAVVVMKTLSAYYDFSWAPRWRLN